MGCDRPPSGSVAAALAIDAAWSCDDLARDQFALSVQPVSAETITTDTNGLDAGEVKVPTADGSIPAYRAMPAQGVQLPTVLVVHEIWGVHEHSRISAAAWRRPAITQSSDLDATAAYAKSTGKADTINLAITGSAAEGTPCGSTPSTTRR